MKSYLYLLVISLAFFSCKRKEVSFTPLNQYENIDTVYSEDKVFINKQLLYIINNYNDGDEALKAMDSCAKVVAGTSPKGFTNFSIIFYKSSDMTNVSHLKETPRDIDRYSQENDMMLSYDWVNGKFMGRSYLHH